MVCAPDFRFTYEYAHFPHLQVLDCHTTSHFTYEYRQTSSVLVDTFIFPICKC